RYSPRPPRRERQQRRVTIYILLPIGGGQGSRDGGPRADIAAAPWLSVPRPEPGRRTNRVEEPLRPAPASQVVLPIPAVLRVVLVGLIDPVAAVVHSVKRERQDRLPGDRVLVRVLVPAVEHEKPVPRPARRKRRQSRDVECETHRIAAL